MHLRILTILQKRTVSIFYVVITVHSLRYSKAKNLYIKTRFKLYLKKK